MKIQAHCSEPEMDNVLRFLTFSTDSLILNHNNQQAKSYKNKT